jgi:hypothetical protein
MHLESLYDPSVTIAVAAPLLGISRSTAYGPAASGQLAPGAPRSIWDGRRHSRETTPNIARARVLDRRLDGVRDQLDDAAGYGGPYPSTPGEVAGGIAQ